MTERKRSAEELILACKTVGCPWDPYPPIYVTTDRLNRRVWEARIRCPNCGSIKYERYRVGNLQQRIGRARYYRPEGWYDIELRFYWGKARQEQLKRGLIQVLDAPPTSE